MGLLEQPHHDGSDLGVLASPSALGDEAVVRLRVPRATQVEAVVLRYVADGEIHFVRAELDEETAFESWWRASFPVQSPVSRYRWLFRHTRGLGWVNGAGVARHDVADADDFLVSPAAGGPDWHLRSVVYQIFPDRFAASGAVAIPPEWGIARAWHEPPTGRGPDTPREWYGGDLPGIEERLGHLVALGVSAIYLTPVFPSRSTHRYDATTFDHVDPLLGGDEALVLLTRAAHARGMRVVGDLTLNHTGDAHDWFLAARADEASPERAFYFFDERLPTGYACWLGVPTLPKLDHTAPELGRRLDAVVRRWLEPPYELDGWRIDVANMVGRYHGIDVSGDVARATRRALEAAKPDALLIAEHAHDFRADLDGGGWHGAMNYAGFMRPVWSWLCADELPTALRESFWAAPLGLLRSGGEEMVAGMRAFRAGVPWHSVLHSWTLLDSHDSARFRTVAGSRERHVVGVGLQMTTPGVPMLFAGDELGLEGAWGEDARRTMPWDRPETWDTALLAEYRRLIALRRDSAALAVGGLRYAFVDADVVAYLRETKAERLLCLASRADHAPLQLPLAALGCSELEPLYGGDALCADGVATLPAGGPSFHVWRLA